MTRPDEVEALLRQYARGPKTSGWSPVQDDASIVLVGDVWETPALPLESTKPISVVVGCSSEAGLVKHWIIGYGPAVLDEWSTDYFTQHGRLVHRDRGQALLARLSAYARTEGPVRASDLVENPGLRAQLLIPPPAPTPPADKPCELCRDGTIAAEIDVPRGMDGDRGYRCPRGHVYTVSDGLDDEGDDGVDEAAAPRPCTSPSTDSGLSCDPFYTMMVALGRQHLPDYVACPLTTRRPDENLVELLRLAAQDPEGDQPGAIPVKWLADFPFDPVLAARRTLTEIGCAWLAASGKAAEDQTLRLFETDPVRNEWAARALFREAGQLSEWTVQCGANVFRSISRAVAKQALKHMRERGADLSALALLGVAVLESLSDGDAYPIFDIACWCHDIATINALLHRAATLGRADLWDDAALYLVGILQDEGSPEEDRLHAARYLIAALRRDPSGHGSSMARVLGHLITAAGDFPLRDQALLRDDIFTLAERFR